MDSQEIQREFPIKLTFLLLQEHFVELKGVIATNNAELTTTIVCHYYQIYTL